MGGKVDVVSSALNVLSGVVNPGTTTKRSGKTSQMQSERAAQEAELKQREAAERKRKRDNVTEARERQRRRQSEKDIGVGYGQTTLLHGGKGLEDDPEVATRQLKTKFGE